MTINMPYKYSIKPEAVWQIESFYLNVSLRYRHTYSFEDQDRNVWQAFSGAFQIEKTLPRRKPTIGRWQKQGWHMANSDKWYYAYTIDGDTITIQDACHAQNMHE